MTATGIESRPKGEKTPAETRALNTAPSRWYAEDVYFS
jgi:hypothetical protein